MSIYVLLIKDYEDSKKVIYKYGPNEGLTGKIKYNKNENTISKVEPIIKKGMSDDFFFQIAAKKIVAMSKKGRFLEKTSIEY